MLSFSEMLKGNQHKIDKNKNGKIDSHDFKLLKKMKKEEVEVEEGSCGCSECSCSDNVQEETLDELSKATLGSYIKKATSDATDKARQSERRAAHAKDSEKRAKDPKLAFASNMNKDLAKHDMKKSADASKKSMKRETGIGKAVSRLTKEETDQLEERNKQNAVKRKMMDASRGARFKAQGNYVPDAEPQHKTAQAHNKAIGRAIRKMSNEEVELDEKLNVAASSMGTVIKDFKKSDAPQFAGKSVEKRRQMAIAAKLQADRMKKEGVEMKSYRQFMEELVSKLPEETELDEAEKATGGLKDACWKGYTAVGMKMKNGKKVPNCVPVKEEAVDEEVEQIDELDINLLKAMQKHAKANPRPKTSSDAIDPKTGKLKPYGYRGKSEYEKSETGDDEEPQKRGRKTGVSVGSYKRRQPK